MSVPRMGTPLRRPPGILLRAGVILSLVLLACGHVSGPTAPPSKYPELERRVLDLVNGYRGRLGLNPLLWSEVVAVQCRSHCERMALEDRYYGHEGFAQRVGAIRRILTLSQASENVACNSGFEDPAVAAFEGWLESPRHREAIEGRFRVTGIGIDRSVTGRYFFAEIFVQQ